MQKYKAIYKCRLCGEVFTCGKECTENKSIRRVSLIGAPSLITPFDFGHTAHACQNGSLGVADLQGFGKVEK